MNEEIEKIRFSLSDDNIIHIECMPKTTMSIEEGRLSTEKVSELTNAQALPMLCDLTNVVKMTQECRQHFAGEEHANVFSKCALIVNSPLSRIIGNFFLGANKPLKPTRIFTNKEKALVWLKNEG